MSVLTSFGQKMTRMGQGRQLRRTLGAAPQSGAQSCDLSGVRTVEEKNT